MSDADLVFQSYGRSCSNAVFFEDFYTIFMGKSSDVSAMFANTNMESQRALLRSGILWLVMHARGLPDTKIRALGESHSKKKMNIKPMYYSLWLDALMETLSRHDPKWTSELEQVWRRTLRPSIDLIQSMYDK
ncbi:globin domain-containing protein [Parathalassolituus penaei]|uniref:Globin n=1 Tax=Parathalassolituus penaei TaxID=2997323 RepID=A0A9X3EAZ5_9GAMM|nr:globin domain-containing protein [Parathalassolituus penaei]MCY0964292.1 globin [Parathalassolituus penaei]